MKIILIAINRKACFPKFSFVFVCIGTPGEITDSTSIPWPWTVGELSTDIGSFLFTYAVTKMENSDKFPVVEKNVQRGGLIHANLSFFNLIRHVEACFAKYASRCDVFDCTLDEVMSTYKFTFPCKEHASDILSYSIIYYIRLRMRQNAHQVNLKVAKKFVVKKKFSKLTNQ